MEAKAAGRRLRSPRARRRRRQRRKRFYKANTPEGLDYGGAEFNICTFPDSSANVYWVDVDFCATEENGDTINDATYQRKRAAEELLNLKIVNIPAKSSAGDQIKASVTTQDGAYDIGFIDTRSASTLSQTGTLLDFTSLSTLDMSAAWVGPELH